MTWEKPLAMIFDTHAHYDHKLYDGKGPEILMDIAEKGAICNVVIPAISMESNYTSRELFPYDMYHFAYFAAGLHPKSVANTPLFTKKTRVEFEKLVDDKRTVAIKTGLDYGKSNLEAHQVERQQQYMKELIEIANDHGKPVVLHIRDAVDDAIRLLKENPIKEGAVVHCYTYDTETANRFFDAGVTYLGIGGKVTKDELPQLQECVANVGIDKILLETDSPFVQPKGYKEHLNTSFSLEMVAKKVAELKNIDGEIVVKKCNKNARAFYKLPPLAIYED